MHGGKVVPSEGGVVWVFPTAVQARRFFDGVPKAFKRSRSVDGLFVEVKRR